MRSIRKGLNPSGREVIDVQMSDVRCPMSDVRDMDMAVTTGMGQKRLSPYKLAKTSTGREGGTDFGDITRETFGGNNYNGVKRGTKEFGKAEAAPPSSETPDEVNSVEEHRQTGLEELKAAIDKHHPLG